MEKRDLVIRFGGETGGGLQSVGQLVTKAAASVGFRVLTFYSPPAEIKGGQAVFEIRLSNRQLYARGDAVDVLWVFDQEGFENNIHDLKPGGLLLFDPADMAQPPTGEYQTLAVPVTEIAKTRLRFERGRNVVAFGMAAALFDFPKEPLIDLLKRQFKRHLELLPQNVAALEAGVTWVEEHVADRSRYRLTGAEPVPGILVLSGNQSLSLGALAAGCRFLAGYPITPASDIMEFMAANLPALGGTVVQAEDEIAAIGMVLGASYAGKKAMTSTSGPGFSLMIEMLGLASMAELPCVIVDAQRAGPSTGMPTRHEQGDLNLAVYGGHGEVPKLVFSPVSVRDCFSTIIEAFNFAERYQVPVVMLQDTVLAVRTESVERFNLKDVHTEYRTLFDGEHAASMASLTVSGNGHGKDEETQEGAAKYARYLSTSAGVSPTSIPGMPGGEYTATGLEHNELGALRYDTATHSAMTEKRHRKLAAAAAEAPAPLRYGNPEAELGIITWGSTAGVVIETIDRLREQGIAVEMLAPRMLWPIPDHQVGAFIRRKRQLIVAEVNYSQQYATMLRARYGTHLESVTTYGGQPFKVEDLTRAILRKVAIHA
ncbi:MAG: 2-oxoacid:acceptor oxidoreductase subunit alpha [Chloroflexi bacterium]|nr:2-oxoacid:acceptor oxidoreductase subunit alpha [Chloroflexota bacterium]